MLKNGLMVAGALVLGFVGSSWWSARAAQKTANRPAPPSEVALAPTSSTPPSLDLGALRAMIREEVQQSRSGTGAAAVPQPDSASAASSADAPESPKQPERPRTPEQVMAQTEATTLIDDGLASGHWRDEDERRWLNLRNEMAKADAVALRLKLFQALNEGRVAGDFDIRAGGRPRLSEATQ
jgi:hypothetical protein